MPKDNDRKTTTQSHGHGRSNMHEGHRSTGSANRKSPRSSGRK